MSQITCSIEYNSESVLCFDPQKLLVSLSQAFPNAEIDREDLSTKEVADIATWAESQFEIDDEVKATMRRQIEGKQRRMGPAYRFRLSNEITGHVNRYTITFNTAGTFGDEDTDAIREFLTKLGAGRISHVATS